MKKILIILFVLSVFSCQNKKLDRMRFVQDSILQVEAAKDSTILGFVSTMNSIQENLDSIRQIEEFVKVQTISGPELSKDSRTNILEDVQTIHRLLQKNKELVAQMQKELEGSKNNITGLQKTILFLNRQIEAKEVQIDQLSAEIEKLHVNIAGLNTRIQRVTAEGEIKDQLLSEKERTIEEQVAEMNTAYYVVGQVKELVEKGVVERGGGILGVGRTAKFRKDFNPDVFIQVDVRELKEISLNSKKAELVTTHPAGSFELVGEEKVESLKILDEQKFWETSKYLVIVVN